MRSLLSYKVKIKPNLKTDDLITAGFLSGCLGYLLVLQFHFSTIQVSPLFWLFVGVMAGLSTISQEVTKFKIPFLKQGQASQSIKYVSIAFTLLAFIFLALPVIADNYFRTAVVEARRENVPKAIKAFRLASKFHFWEEEYPLSELRALTLIAEKTQNKKAIKEAGVALAKAQRLNPADANLYFYQGDFYFARGELTGNLRAFRKAKEVYEKLLSLDPNFAQGRMRLGASYFALGELNRAIAEWKRASHLIPDSPNPFYNIAYAYEKLGRYSEAKRFYKKVLIIDEENQEAKAAILRLSAK
jgi:tetratricopeptide (TPR) repeat protein